MSRHDETTSNSTDLATIFLGVQGVIKAFDPSSGDGIVIRDTDLSEYNIAVRCT